MAFLAPIAEAGAEVLGEGAAEGAAAEGAEAAEAGELDDMPGGELNLGGGHSMHLSEEQFEELAHSESVVAAITDRAQKCADIGNELAVTFGAKYAVQVNNDPSRSRATAAVYAANYKAVVDDAHHSTLLKAAAQTGSDPRTEPTEPEEPERESPEEESGLAEEAGGEGGEVAEIAEAL